MRNVALHAKLWVLGHVLNMHMCIRAHEKKWKPEDAPLVPVTSSHFAFSTVKSDCTLEEFQTEKQLESNTLNVFLEFNSVDIPQNRDVILMDKVKYLIILKLANHQ